MNDVARKGYNKTNILRKYFNFRTLDGFRMGDDITHYTISEIKKGNKIIQRKHFYEIDNDIKFELIIKYPDYNKLGIFEINAEELNKLRLKLKMRDTQVTSSKEEDTEDYIDDTEERSIIEITSDTSDSTIAYDPLDSNLTQEQRAAIRTEIINMSFMKDKTVTCTNLLMNLNLYKSVSRVLLDAKKCLVNVMDAGMRHAWYGWNGQEIIKIEADLNSFTYRLDILGKSKLFKLGRLLEENKSEYGFMVDNINKILNKTYDNFDVRIPLTHIFVHEYMLKHNFDKIDSGISIYNCYFIWKHDKLDSIDKNNTLYMELVKDKVTSANKFIKTFRQLNDCDIDRFYKVINKNGTSIIYRKNS